MASCGCTLSGSHCPIGGELFAHAFMLAEAIGSSFFASLTEEQQRQLWQEYYQTSQDYLCHCGYSPNPPCSFAFVS